MEDESDDDPLYDEEQENIPPHRCIICEKNAVNLAFIPCGHSKLCFSCYEKKIKNKENVCPICKIEISTIYNCNFNNVKLI